MRWAIRQQILVPIILIQTLTVAAITFASVVLAERRAEGEIVHRLESVVEVVGKSNFPLNDATLARMQGLSGARFIAYGPGDGPSAASDPSLITAAPPIDSIPSLSRREVSRLSESPSLRIDGQDHLAALISPPGLVPRKSLLVLYPEASWRQARRAAGQIPLILGIAAMVPLAALTSWIAQRISARVRRLEQQVARIANGDFREVPAGSGQPADEVEDLANSINLMCSQLREMSRSVRDSERSQLLAQLAAGLAHQLRNALTGARLSIQLHERRCELARSERSMAVALRQLALVEEQVKGLLTLGQVEPRPRQATDLSVLLQEVALLLQPSCEHARVRLSVADHSGPALAIIHEPGVRAAVLNLALNAVEAAGPGGEVALEVLEKAPGWILEVSDTGPGPPLAIGQTLFDPFVTGKPEGIGLGLALAKHVAEAHDGSLSWGRDEGRTRFRLNIPAASRVEEPD